MNIALLLEMAAEGAGERVALGPRCGGTSYRELLRLAANAGEWLASQPGRRAGLLDGNSAAVPLLLFGSALAGKAFVPVSYRLAAGQLHAVLARLGQCVLVTAPDAAPPVPLPEGVAVKTRGQFLGEVGRGAAAPSTPVPAPARSPHCCLPAARPARRRPPSCASISSRPTSSARWSSSVPSQGKRH